MSSYCSYDTAVNGAGMLGQSPGRDGQEVSSSKKHFSMSQKLQHHRSERCGTVAIRLSIFDSFLQLM